MKITGSYNPYELNNTEPTSSKPKTENEYANYLMKKYPCLSPGKNSVVYVTGGLLRKAMSDEKTGEWLERELSKAPDYIKQAQQSAIAHGATLKFCSIEFGEEYSTMCTLTVHRTALPTPYTGSGSPRACSRHQNRRTPH